MVVDGYVRVSRVRGRGGETFLSPTLQRERIQAWCTMRGATLDRVFEELDESGARSDRPLLEEAIVRVERGASNGIVVATLDRFGRSLLDSLAAIERIHHADGVFASVAEGLDVSTETGRLVLRIMLSMAEWELARMRQQWVAAQGKAIARGVHLGGRPPAGYRHDARRGLVTKARDTPAIRAAFALRGADGTLREVGAVLRDGRVRSATGSLAWPPSSVRVLLANRVYLGELHCGSHVLEGAHEAIVDPEIFAAAQRAPRPWRGPGRARTLLGGILRCASCGAPMHAQRSRGCRSYHAGSPSSRGRCCDASPAIAASIIEPYAEWAFLVVQEALARSAPGELIRELQARRARAMSALEAFRDDPAILDALGRERFAAGLDERARQEQQAARDLVAARESNGELGLIGRSAWESRWPQLDVEGRRVALQSVFERIDVRTGSGPVQTRVSFVPRAAAQHVGLDRAGFAPAPPSEPSWGRPEIRRRLKQAIAGNDGRLPSGAELTAAGHGALRREVELTGGPPRWARELGVAWTGPLPKGYWTEARIRATLRCLGRWHSDAELRALGYGGLHGALKVRGPEAWAAELGYALPAAATAAPWTPARARGALEALVGDLGSYPSDRDFRQAGLAGLERALRRQLGGHDRWADELGVARRAARRRRPVGESTAAPR